MRKTENGKEEGNGWVRWNGAGLRSVGPVQGPGGDAGDERAHSEGEVDRHREGEDHKREAQVVLSHRRS